MAAITPTPIKVNDLVKVDGDQVGRVTRIMQPLNSFNVFVVKTQFGEIEAARYRLKVLPETVSSESASASMPSNLKISTFLPESVVNDLLEDDFLDPPIATSSERFVPVSDAEVDKFLLINENENTMKKTRLDMNLVYKFLKERLQDQRQLEDIPPAELNNILCKFFISARKSDGTEYEPSTLRGIKGSIERYLKRHEYGYILADSLHFAKLRDVLTSKAKALKKQGKGNLPQRADPVSDSELKTLRERGQLGTGTPESLLNTLWWNNTIYFGLRSATPHRRMLWGDITLRKDSQDNEFLQYVERQTKTRQGDQSRDVAPKAWAQPGDSCCPVAVYKRYRDLRPADYCNPQHPFYIATNTQFGIKSEIWFKRQPVGKNKLGSLMKNMALKAGLSRDKRLTNHSARKRLIQTLSDNGVPAHQIMQISGHKNVNSINSYSSINEKQHQSINNILSNPSNLNQSHDRPNAVTPAFQAQPQTAAMSMPMTSQSHSLSHAVNLHSVHTLFSGPIYGGVFNFNISNESTVRRPSAPKRRVLAIESDSD